MKLFVLLCFFVFLVAAECPTQMGLPSANDLPPALMDGAYGGIVTFQEFDNGTLLVTDTVYQIVEIEGGAVVSLRKAQHPNGPFSCWKAIEGEEIFSSGFQSYSDDTGTEFSGTQTITDVSANRIVYVAAITLDEDQLTGTGDIQIATSELSEIDFSEELFVSRPNRTHTITWDGTLSRLGDFGTLPMPEGLSGGWRLVVAETGEGAGSFIFDNGRLTAWLASDTNIVIVDSDLFPSRLDPEDVWSRQIIIDPVEDNEGPLTFRFEFRVASQSQLVGSMQRTDIEDSVLRGVRLERNQSVQCD